MPLFFVSTVMTILPVYTTSKLHAARISLRQTPSSTPGVLFNYAKGVVFSRKWAWFAKFSWARKRARPPLHEILDPPLHSHLSLSVNGEAHTHSQDTTGDWR